MSVALRRRLFGAALALTFAALLLLNLWTPLLADDFRYMDSFATGERITSVGQLPASIAAHWRTVNGRVVTHFCAQLMLLAGKTAFSFVNALMGLLLLLGLYRLARGRGEPDLTLLLALLGGGFLFLPAFGQTCLWLDGACNYLWGGTLIAWTLVPFRDAWLDDARLPAPAAVALCLGCLMMGTVSENASPAAVLLMLLCMLGLRLQKRRVAPWMPMAAALACAGWLLMILSPASLDRNATTALAETSLSGQLFQNFAQCVGQLLEHAAVPGCAFLTLFALALSRRDDPRRLAMGAALFVAALAANFAMTASNYYPDRAFFGGMLLLLLACAAVAPRGPAPDRGLWRAAALCAAFLAFFTFLNVAPDNYNRFQEMNRRADLMRQAAAEGNLDVLTYGVSGRTAYDPFTDMVELTPYASEWQNQCYARYFGLRSVAVTEVR